MEQSSIVIVSGLSGDRLESEKRTLGMKCFCKDLTGRDSLNVESWW